MTRRDPVLVTCGWVSFVSFSVALMCLSVLSPLAYMWILGTVGCVAILVGGMAAAGSMAGDGIIGCYFAVEMVKGVFQLIGVILCAMAEASK
jgi:hypothetical protein